MKENNDFNLFCRNINNGFNFIEMAIMQEQEDKDKKKKEEEEKSDSNIYLLNQIIDERNIIEEKKKNLD